ncbi:gluconate 2-dehydrogenase subunit 3 family protein [Glaciecola sp. SC05]|uniref:gluconate 2-dehydrogenase subunit 3 family protein n=1 Tax=Glaciecola sp. SC05 TaxID=1987355 RepID=UPI003526CEFC
MERRDILKLAAALTGSAMLSPLTSSLLYASVNDASAGTLNRTPAFFSKEVYAQLTQVMDVILPRTDTPSASDVKVPSIMDNMFNKVFKHGYRDEFLKRFALLQGYLAEQNFASADADAQLSIIKGIEAKSYNKQDPVYRAYIDLKQQTISYYLATEEVAEKHLNYLPIPVQYIPRISVKEVGGKAWAE